MVEVAAQGIACLLVLFWGQSLPHSPPDSVVLTILVAAIVLEAWSVKLPGAGFCSLAFPLYLGMALTRGVGPAMGVAFLAITARTLMRGSGQVQLRLREGLADLVPALGALALVGVVGTLWLQVLLGTQVHVALTLWTRGGIKPWLEDANDWLQATSRTTLMLPMLGLMGGLFAFLLRAHPIQGLWMIPVLVALRLMVGEAIASVGRADYANLAKQLATSLKDKAKLEQRLEHARQGIHDKTNEVVTMEELSTSLLGATTVKGCLELIVQMVGRLVRCQSVVLFMRQGDGYLSPQCYRSPYSAQIEEARLKGCKEPKVEQAFGRSFAGSSVFVDEDQSLAVALGNYGVLYVGRPDEPFTDTDRQLLALAVRQGVAGLETASRFEVQQHALDLKDEDRVQVLKPGAMLVNRYRMVRVVTSGGMGAVYQAEDTHLNDSPCAVKQMLEEHLGPDAAFVQRKFEEEKALLARLQHPGIPRVRDFFRVGGQCYIVMDYIHGANLDQELSDCVALTGRPFLPEVLVRDMLAVTEILAYLHELSPPVLHRDIKPGNMIREFKSGKVMLVDFGLARAADTTNTQTAVGTWGFSPLEQVQGRAEPRSDIYGLGVSMRFLLTNRPPVTLEFLRLRDIDPSLDPELAAIVDKASAPAPEDRYRSARELQVALMDWQVRPGRA